MATTDNPPIKAAAVQSHSSALRKELGLLDLVLAQILIIIVADYMGTAVKAGSSHVVFWILAIATFLRSAGSGRNPHEPPAPGRRWTLRMGAHRLQRSDRISRRLESLAVRDPLRWPRRPGHRLVRVLCNSRRRLDRVQQMAHRRRIVRRDCHHHVHRGSRPRNRQVDQQRRSHRLPHHDRRADRDAVL